VLILPQTRTLSADNTRNFLVLASKPKRKSETFLGNSYDNRDIAACIEVLNF